MMKSIRIPVYSLHQDALPKGEVRNSSKSGRAPKWCRGQTAHVLWFEYILAVLSWASDDLNRSYDYSTTMDGCKTSKKI